LAGKPQQALRVVQQYLAFGGEHQPAPLAVEQARAEARLETLYARGDVRLHAVERARRAQDAALLGDRLEDAQLGQIHDSLKENETFSIIHFSGMPCQSTLCA